MAIIGAKVNVKNAFLLLHLFLYIYILQAGPSDCYFEDKRKGDSIVRV